MTITIVGLFLVLIEIFRSLPACSRVYRKNNADGWSILSLGVLVGNAPGWILMSALVQSWWALAANAIWFILGTCLLVMVARLKTHKRMYMISIVFLTLFIDSAVYLLGLYLNETVLFLGIILSVMSLGVGLPALIEGLTSVTTKGLSIWNLITGTLEGIIYLLSGLGFGLLTQANMITWGFIFYGSLAIIYNLPRLIRTSYRRLRHLE